MMRVKSQGPYAASLMLVLGVAMLGMPAAMVIAFSSDGPVPAGVWALAVMFGPIGLLIVYFSAKALLRRIRYGAWELECPDPGVPLGQTSVVTVIPRQAVIPIGEIACALVCFRSTGARREHGRTTSQTSKMHDHAWSFQGAAFHPRAGLPITLSLPGDGLPSSSERKNHVQWKLSVKVPAEGAIHDMEFEIPVVPARLDTRRSRMGDSRPGSHD